MRLLHCIASVDPKMGGPIEGLRQRAALLHLWGHEVEVCSLDDPSAEYIGEHPFPVTALGPGKGAFGYAPRMKPWLLENAGRFDAVIVNGIWQYHSLAARAAMTRLGKPYWVFTHGMLDPWFNEAYPLKRLKKNLYWSWGEYRVLRDAAGVIFTTEEEKVLARRSFRPYKVNEIVVSYGTAGPDVPRDEALEAFHGLCPGAEPGRYLLFLSRIHTKKGCDLLIEAFGKVADNDPGLQLVVAGPDQQALVPGLSVRARELGLADRVLFPGMLAGAPKWGAFYGADAFVLPSHQENFGIVVAEALACGTPTLVSKKVNLWREVTEGEAGLADTDDEAGTIRLLEAWLAMSNEQRVTMRRNARALFEARFTVEGSAKSLLAVVGGATNA
ncbi:MAG: glycosyltransferase [Fimbriimonadaceae bacterium]